MNHPTEGQILSLLDGELRGEERREVDAHLSRCADCTRAAEHLRAASDRFARSVQALGRPAPEADPADVRRSAGTPRVGRDWSRIGRVAAAVVALVGGAAVALPGSPVRDWIGRSLEDAAAFFTGEGEVGQQAPAPPARIQRAEEAVIAVAPKDGKVVVSIEDAVPGAILRVRLSERGAAAVHGGSDYRTAPGSIRVGQVGEGGLVVELPRGASEARVELRGETLAVKLGPRFRAVATPIGSAGQGYAFRARGER